MLNYDDETIQLYKEKVKELLTFGEASKTVKKTTGEDITYENVKGCEEIKERKEINRTVTTTSLKNTPSWLLNSIENSLNIERAIELLQANGYIVIDPTMKTENDTDRGITSETVKVIENVLYGELLGIKELPEGKETE